MATAPKNASHLAKLLSSDKQLRRDLFDLITEVDDRVREGSQAALLEAIKRGRIDLRGLEHSEVTDALKSYYQDINLTSKYVKMY